MERATQMRRQERNIFHFCYDYVEERQQLITMTINSQILLLGATGYLRGSDLVSLKKFDPQAQFKTIYHFFKISSCCMQPARTLGLGCWDLKYTTFVEEVFAERVDLAVKALKY
ncbi:hypothetical protein ACEPAF_9349 [Sanghuangporus sanghuang]